MDPSENKIPATTAVTLLDIDEMDSSENKIPATTAGTLLDIEKMDPSEKKYLQLLVHFLTLT